MNPKRGARIKHLEDSAPFPMQAMSQSALDAEKLANTFGLGYLSPTGFHKLADIIEHVKAGCFRQADRDKLDADVVVSKPKMACPSQQELLDRW